MRMNMRLKSRIQAPAHNIHNLSEEMNVIVLELGELA